MSRLIRENMHIPRCCFIHACYGTQKVSMHESLDVQCLLKDTWIFLWYGHCLNKVSVATGNATIHHHEIHVLWARVVDRQRLVSTQDAAGIRKCWRELGNVFIAPAITRIVVLLIIQLRCVAKIECTVMKCTVVDVFLFFYFFIVPTNTRKPSLLSTVEMKCSWK